MTKEINLEEILEKHLAGSDEHFLNYSKKEILEAMKDACDQTIDLCAENAKIKEIDLSNENDDHYEFVVNDESILKTKDQIK
jgi:hypothetical protein